MNLNQYCAQKNSVHRVKKNTNNFNHIMIIRRQTVDPNGVSELCDGLRNFSFLTSLKKYS